MVFKPNHRGVGTAYFSERVGTNRGSATASMPPVSLSARSRRRRRLQKPIIAWPHDGGDYRTRTDGRTDSDLEWSCCNTTVVVVRSIDLVGRRLLARSEPRRPPIPALARTLCYWQRVSWLGRRRQRAERVEENIERRRRRSRRRRKRVPDHRYFHRRRVRCSWA